MHGKIQLHLMMLISFLLCNTSSMVLAACIAIAEDEQMSMPQEHVISAALLFEGDVVEILPSGEAMHKTANLRGKRFEWLGQIGKGVAEEKRFHTVDVAPNIEISGRSPRGL